MADKPGAKKDDGGNAVDGLTPPTMKYPGPAETEKTQIGPPPSGGALKTTRAGSSPTITGEIGTGGTVHADIVVQDLSTERLLKDAPRVEHNGKQVPALNGIPLLTKIGQGGMGAVYYGVHPRLRSEVAVKVLPFHLAEQDPGMIRRFFREAQIAAQVRSPHLVNVMDVNEESGLFFLVMEYVAGSTAGHLLKSVVEQGHIGLPELDALDIAIAATEGLHAAHSQGIVHRDLKPENIMVPYLSREEKKYDLKASKLMDLGLARSEESNNQSLTGVQAAMGTPGYMAPEQALDAKTANRASDVFGMGATIYALLTGRAPFRAEAVMKVLMATMHEPHEPVIKIRPDVSPVISEIVDKCLDKKQENRFPDAQTLNRALKNARRLLGGSSDGGDPEGVDLAALSASVRAPGRSVTATPGQAPGSQATIVGAPPQSGTNVGGQSKKGMMLIAAGVVAVLAIGGALFAFGGKEKPKDPGQGNNTPIVTPDKPDKPIVVEPKYKILAGDDINFTRDLQITMLGKVESNIAAGNLPLAKTYLKQIETATADLMPLDKIDAKDKEFKEYRAWLDKEYAAAKSALENKEKKVEWAKKSRSIQELIDQGDFEKAQTELTAAIKILPNDKDAKADHAKKLDDVASGITKKKTRNEFDVLMKQAVDLEKTDTAKALEVVGKALDLIKDDADALNAQDRLKKSIDLAQRKKAFDTTFRDAETAEKNNQDKRALELAYKAVELMPEEAKAKALAKKIEDKLGDAERKELAEKTRKDNLLKLDTAIKEASDLFDKQKLDEADTRAGQALDLFKMLALNEQTDKRVAELKKKIDTAIQERKKSDEFRQKQEKFAKLSQKVFADINIDGLDTDTANKIKIDIQAMKALDIDAAKVTEAEKKLQARIDYEKAVKIAGTALDEGKLDEASKQIQTALTAIPEGTAAKELNRILKDRQEKAAAKANKEKFDGIMKLAAEAETKNNLDEATRQIGLAKELNKTDKALLDLERKVGEKIAAREKLKAQYEATKKDFAAKFAEIDKLAPEAADAMLKDFKTKMPDGDVFKAELAQINAKMPDLQKALAAKADQAVAEGLKKIKDTLNTTRDLGGAVNSLQTLAQTYPNRADLNQRLSGVKSVSTLISEVLNAGQTYRGKADQAKGKVKSGGEAEKGRVDTALARFNTIASEGVTKLIGADLVDTNVSAGLRTDKDAAIREIEEAIKALERVKPAKPVTPDDFENESGGKRSSNKEQPKSETGKKTNRSSAGEIDPFNE
ncbi:MAG TPA: protein kinase [Planctomycetota bacterium]|nr:protein kinase [Planctomycetota bacterium]